MVLNCIELFTINRSLLIPDLYSIWFFTLYGFILYIVVYLKRFLTHPRSLLYMVLYQWFFTWYGSLSYMILYFTWFFIWYVSLPYMVLYLPWFFTRCVSLPYMVLYLIFLYLTLLLIYLIFQHDGGEHLQTGIHPQQLQGEMEGEVNQGKSGVVRQGKQKRGLEIFWQNLHLSRKYSVYIGPMI